MAKVAFTAGRVAGFKCPPDKRQAFMWDATTPGLGLRSTPSGQPAYVFQGVYQGKDVRITIGSPAAWSIPDAQAKARELQRLIDEGRDPRELKRNAIAEAAAHDAASAARVEADRLAAVTAGEAWRAYVEARAPYWGDRHREDHDRLSKAGGEKPRNGRAGLTVAGPIHPLLSLPLRDLTAPAVEAWAAEQAKTRKTVARLALRCLKAFLGWCAEQPEYAPAVQSSNPAKSKRAREALGKPGVKQDALMREQLPAWFDAVGRLPNPVVAAYLKTVLLTGARPGEVLTLRWEDLNTQWRGITIRDKVEGERVIPLTPYVYSLLATLPRRNQWVFASPRNDRPGEHMTRLDPTHSAACTAAGIDGLTLHGLRRSFKSLTEWIEIPAGVVAQIMGHKPSATAEKHYTVRPLDLLRLHHERIEAWILEQAGIQFDRAAEPGRLRAVA